MPVARTLANDVRLLGDTLGEVLRAHGGDALFEHVESMRGAAKRARDLPHGDPAGELARDALATEAGSLGPEMALEVVRAFTLYFQLINQAEDVHRTRELRRRECDLGRAGVSESLHAVVAELADAGASRATALEALAEVNLSFVFTAHPTEARRRTTERLLADVRRALEDLDRRALTPTEETATRLRLEASVEALWEHGTERPDKPEVLDEVKAGLWYLRNVLLDAVPRVQRSLADALSSRFGPTDPAELPMTLRFGSWMGGDRDGNPFVNDAITERTLELHRWIVLERYIADLDDLVDPLSMVAHRIPPLPALDEALERAATQVPEAAHLAASRNPHEPLRRLLTFMRERLVRTRSFSAGAYPRPEVFLDDLAVLRDALRCAHARALPEDRLLDLILRVHCFGFVLASLDVREDSRVHRRVIAELLDDPSYENADDETRIAKLPELRLPERGHKVSPEARRLLDLMDTVRRLHARFGPESVGCYIISMTSGPADVLEIFRLAELYGVADELDVVPLLETREALQQARPLLTRLLGETRYRDHVRRRGEVQELLVGYSDSMRVAGILASRVGVLEAQRATTEVCAEHGVRLRVFHGRGGSVSRGGGPTYRALRALPPEVFSGDAKITEQGEVRAFHFSNPDLAERYLEQTLGAAFAVRHEARAGVAVQSERERLELTALAEDSHAAYRDLVDDEGLVPFFQTATPFAHIAELNIASRPAKRRAGELTLEHLRAIPWVFSFSQSRAVITGWYGVGKAFGAQLSTPGGEARLRHLYETAPFFRDLVDNVEMTLAKSDLPIATRYAALCPDDDVREAIFGRIRDEHARTVRTVMRVTRAEHLLDDDAVVRTSIALRNPYVDPLSYLQVEAMRRVRSGDDEEDWAKVARASVQGIAAGLRNTG